MPLPFPNLHQLSTNGFYDASFSHLSTLALEGTHQQDIPDPLLIAALLNCALQLECLWLKHHFAENYEDSVKATSYPPEPFSDDFPCTSHAKNEEILLFQNEVGS